MSMKYQQPNYRMFAGELEGHLVLSHISARADSVRDSIADMFLAPPSLDVTLAGEASVKDRLKVAWRKARKDGWRVVPVKVSR